MRWTLGRLHRAVYNFEENAPISESRPNHNSLGEVHWSFTANQYRKNVGDGTYGLSSISEKTNHLQMSLLRQQILLLFEDPECWSGLGLEPSTSPSTFQHSIT